MVVEAGSEESGDDVVLQSFKKGPCHKKKTCCQMADEGKSKNFREVVYNAPRCERNGGRNVLGCAGNFPHYREFDPGREYNFRYPQSTDLYRSTLYHNTPTNCGESKTPWKEKFKIFNCGCQEGDKSREREPPEKKGVTFNMRPRKVYIDKRGKGIEVGRARGRSGCKKPAKKDNCRKCGKNIREPTPDKNPCCNNAQCRNNKIKRGYVEESSSDEECCHQEGGESDNYQEEEVYYEEGPGGESVEVQYGGCENCLGRRGFPFPREEERCCRMRSYQRGPDVGGDQRHRRDRQNDKAPPCGCRMRVKSDDGLPCQRGKQEVNLFRAGSSRDSHNGYHYRPYTRNDKWAYNCCNQTRRPNSWESCLDSRTHTVNGFTNYSDVTITNNG